MDAEAGDEYDGYLMYSNEVLKSPVGSKTPSVSGDGGYPELRADSVCDCNVDPVISIHTLDAPRHRVLGNVFFMQNMLALLKEKEHTYFSFFGFFLIFSGF